MALCLKDISKALNISVSTISRVVNNKSIVKPETRDLILKYLKENDYRPNQIARSLKNKSSKTIGVIIPDISEPFFSRIIKGFDSIISLNGYSVILCDTNEDSKKEESYINLLIEKQIDGILIATVSLNYNSLSMLIKQDFPVIFIDNLPSIDENYNSVILDNVKASYLATDYLISLGHKNIGIITGNQQQTTGYDRLLGYKKAFENNNVPIKPDFIKIGDFKEKSGYELTKELLHNNKDLTAIYTTSCKMTYGAIKAMKELKVSIPDDISLVGFDVQESDILTPSITSIIQPEQKIGRVVAELMNNNLQKAEDTYTQKILIEPMLQIKDSCKPILILKEGGSK